MEEVKKHVILLDCNDEDGIEIKVSGRNMGCNRFDIPETIEGAHVSFRITSTKYSCNDITAIIASRGDRKPRGPEMDYTIDRQDDDCIEGHFIMPDSVVRIQGIVSSDAKMKEDKSKMDYALHIINEGSHVDGMSIDVQVSGDGVMINKFENHGYIPSGAVVTVTNKMPGIFPVNISATTDNGDQVHLNYLDLPPASRINTEGYIISSHSFIMPADNVTLKIHVYNPDSLNVNLPNEVTESSDGVIDYFLIPDDMAKELSELLTRQAIKERMLLQLTDDPVKYERVESSLVPIVSKVEAIKHKITKQYVPVKYNSAKYQWNYDGYEIDANKVQIIELK